MNIIHVEDLCQVVDRLIDRQVANEIFNIGGADVSSDDFFRAVGQVAGRRVRLLTMNSLLRRLVPSSAWFFGSNVNIDCAKVRAVTGIEAQRPLVDLVASDAFSDLNVDSVESMRKVQHSGVPFKAYGLGYSLMLSLGRRLEREKRVMMEPYRGIVSLIGDLVTVKAGTTLSAVSAFVDQVDLTLATLAEFSGVTAGACFYVDVHGSSSEYFSLLDLIVEVKYLDAGGQVAACQRGDASWEALRRRDAGFFLTGVTFQCQPVGNLTNQVEFLRDDRLASYLAHEHRNNLSTVIQYPLHRKMMVYNINRAESPPSKAARPMQTYRHASYRF